MKSYQGIQVYKKSSRYFKATNTLLIIHGWKKNSPRKLKLLNYNKVWHTNIEGPSSSCPETIFL